jgi:ribosomal protein L32
MPTCQHCKTDNPPDFKFCQECGEALIPLNTCPECGHNNQPDFNYCMNCGHTLLPSTPPSTSERSPRPVPQYPQPQPAQPQVIVIQEPQQPQRSPFFSLITRFVTSMVVGFVLGKVWQILGESILAMF